MVQIKYVIVLLELILLEVGNIYFVNLWLN